MGDRPTRLSVGLAAAAAAAAIAVAAAAVAAATGATSRLVRPLRGKLPVLNSTLTTARLPHTHSDL